MEADPEVREKLRAKAHEIIADVWTWRAIEALAIVLHQRTTLTGPEATEVIESAY
jgi:hypothetical protein